MTITNLTTTFVVASAGMFLFLAAIWSKDGVFNFILKATFFLYAAVAIIIIARTMVLS